MADQLPSANDLFDNLQPAKQLPKADDIFGTSPAPYQPQYIGPSATWQQGINRVNQQRAASGAKEDFLSQTSLGRVLNAFGQGAANAWGKEPLGLSPETQTSIAKAGIDQKSILAVPEEMAGAFNSGIIQEGAIAADGFFRSLSAGVGGVASAANQAADEYMPSWMKKAYEGITGTKYNTGNNVLSAEDTNALNTTLQATFPFIPEAGALSTIDDATYAGLKKPAPEQLLPRQQAFDQIINEIVAAKATRKVESPVGTPTVATSEVKSATPLPTNLAIKKDKSGFYVERTNPDGTTTNYRGQGDLKTEQDFVEYVQKSPKFKDDWKNNAPVPAKATEPTSPVALPENKATEANGAAIPQEVTPANSPEPPAPSIETPQNNPVQYDMPIDNGKPIDTNALGEAGDLEKQVLGGHSDLALFNQYQGTPVLKMSDAELLSETFGVDTHDIYNRQNPYSNLDPIQAQKIAKAGVQMGEKLQETGRSVVDEPTALAWLLEANKVVQAGDDVSGIAKMQGRALRAQALTKADRMKMDAITRFLKDNVDVPVAVGEDGHLTPAAIEAIKKLANEVSKLNDPTAVNRAIRQKAKDLKSGVADKLQDIVLEYAYNAMLSSPKTHMANIIGNTLAAFWRVPETALAGGIGAAREIITGSKDRVYVGEAGMKLLGLLQGIPEGFKAAVKTIKQEEPTLGGTKLEHPKAIHMEGDSKLAQVVNAAGHGIRLPGTFLQAEDEVFKAMAYRASLNAQAFRQAKQAGLGTIKGIAKTVKVLDNATDDMRVQAVADAKYDTFTKDLGTIGKHLQAVGRHPLGKIPKFLFIPFAKFSVNNFKWLTERTPLYPIGALANTEMRAVLSGKRGKAVRDEQIAKMVLGTAVLIPVVKWAISGMLTNSGPSDPQKHAEYISLNKPTAFKVGDQWYDYSRIAGPFAPWLNAVSKAVDSIHASDPTDDELARLGTMLLAAGGGYAQSLPFANGIQDLDTAINSNDGYAVDKLLRSWGQRFVPAIGGDIQRIQNPTVNEWWHVYDPYIRDAKTFSEAVEAKTPGQSQKVPFLLDEFGMPIKKDQPSGGDVLGFFNPVSTRQANVDPIKKAMHDVGYFMGRPNDTVNGIKMSREQFYQYQVNLGIATRMAFERFINTPGWNNLPTGARKEILVRQRDQAIKMARIPVLTDSNMEMINKSIEKKLELWK